MALFMIVGKRWHYINGGPKIMIPVRFTSNEMGTKVKQEIVLWINLSWFQNLCSITIFLVGLCILCFIKSKLGSHLSKCSLKSWRLWGKLVQRAKFSIKFWRCRPGQGRGNNLTTILLHIFKFNEKELVLLSRWPLTLAEPTFVCRTPFSYILRPYWNQ